MRFLKDLALVVGPLYGMGVLTTAAVITTLSTDQFFGSWEDIMIAALFWPFFILTGILA